MEIKLQIVDYDLGEGLKKETDKRKVDVCICINQLLNEKRREDKFGSDKLRDMKE